MYRNAPIRTLGQDDSDPLSFLQSVTTTPINVSLSPLMIGGLGLLALAFVLSGTKKAAGAVRRKSKAVRRALRA
jgi:hypothetical protein